MLLVGRGEAKEGTKVVVVVVVVVVASVGFPNMAKKARNYCNSLYQYDILVQGCKCCKTIPNASAVSPSS